MSQANSTSSSRREFLVGLGACGAAAWTGGSIAAEPASPQQPRLRQLSPHLAIYEGQINVGVVRDGAKALLIDCGDGSVLTAIREAGISAVDQMLFTHHHRDQACGAAPLIAAGAKARVPAGEREHFANVAAYWGDPKNRWHLYNQHPHHLMLAESIAVDAVAADGDELTWGPARIRTIATPGHTDGSVSYLVEVDDKRTVFCGDAIYDEGQIWELYSLQKGTVTSDYHGFLGAMPQLTASLGRIKSAQPDRLVPSHGRVMDQPARAIDLLVRRLGECYEKYAAISALRHYFPKMFVDYAGRPGQMPIRPGKPVPGCLRHFGTTWVLVAKDKSAFVMDCGGPDVVKRLQDMVTRGEVSKVEGLWITHYHDDHVDAVPAFQAAFNCPCYTDQHVADVIANPTAWRLPCISPSRARVDRPTRNGQSWDWHEFRMTAYHFPGQTLYHSGLLVESGELRMFFAGDSFTMAGIDDYCAHNRNWLGRGVGFDRCIELFEKLQPTHIFNCHVDPAFDFTPDECRFMRANLAEREKLFGSLFPWDHANYGMDEPWVRCFPYEQRAAGANLAFDVVVTNHSATARTIACRAALPSTLGGGMTAWVAAEIPAKQDGSLPIAIKLPAGAKPGRYVVAIDLRHGDRVLPQFTEAIMVV